MNNHSPTTNHQSLTTAFTLIELVIVIAIISILAIILKPQYPADTIELRAQAEEIVSSIRYAQALSMTRGERFRINFTSTSYSFTDLAGTTSLAHPATNATTTNMVGAITLALNAAIPNNYLAFDGRGIPYTTNVLPGTTLSSAGIITLTSGSETQTVQVTPETGRVMIQ
ncbi:MAG: prepilin-type N-terminal cleavage/methylation domain-containing protein [Gammaproteobacteria bacterium]|nr:prepilin-type N-terminal cleavage/methylation domain-containing protein [Gammaproteobacteria bacterium]